jgi:deoxyribonuclease-4
MKIGFHVSIRGGIDKAVDRAEKLECTTFQIFTRNPRAWRARELKKEEIEAFHTKLEESGIYPVFSHMPYIPNLSSPDEEIYNRSLESLIEETKRCRLLGIPYIVTHLGSHLGTGSDKARDRVAEALKKALAKDDEINILLENTSGSPNQIGSDFSEIAQIIKRAGDHRIGVCFDTCHAYASGMDIKTPKGLEETLEEIERKVGLAKLKLIHLNDSAGEMGSHNDKHEHIGLGEIGEEGFKRILKSKLAQRPIILETPKDDRRDDRGNCKRVMELSRN